MSTYPALTPRSRISNKRLIGISTPHSSIIACIIGIAEPDPGRLFLATEFKFPVKDQ